MTGNVIGHALTRLGEWSAHPAAFGLVVVYITVWLIFDHKSMDWHAVTELIVLCMTLFIVRSEHREFQALHAKLDEVLRAEGRGSARLINIDHREPEEVEKHREQKNESAKE
jgi:low affinity Fe/Cu permease